MTTSPTRLLVASLLTGVLGSACSPMAGGWTGTCGELAVAIDLDGRDHGILSGTYTLEGEGSRDLWAQHRNGEVAAVWLREERATWNLGEKDVETQAFAFVGALEGESWQGTCGPTTTTITDSGFITGGRDQPVHDAARDLARDLLGEEDELDFELDLTSM